MSEAQADPAPRAAAEGIGGTAGGRPSALGRTAWPIGLLFFGLTSALLVARLPSDPDRRIMTRRHHNSDPLLTATLLQLNTASLLHHPSRYFQPPILFPDPNPYRSTEPFIAEALLAVPFRLVLGPRPALVYTSVLVTTLTLVACFTGLLLRELGVRTSLALAGGCLSVLIATTTVFVDRLQSLSIQWLPLGLFFASRYWRQGGATRLVAFALCAFLTVQASLYTSVMLVAAALFLLPLVLALRGVPGARRRVFLLAQALGTAAVACILALWPYLRDREDVAAYSSAAYAPEKPWGQAFLAELAISPPEYGQIGWPLEPWASWDGVYPGAGFVLLVASVAVLAAARSRHGPRDPGWRSGASPTGERCFGPAFRSTTRGLALLLTLLVGSLAWSALSGGSATVRALADGLLWAVLATWCLRLALWPVGDADEAGCLRLLASAAWLAGFVLLLLSLGSPIALSVFDPPLLRGLFAPLSSALPALRELRELKRFLLPAGWAAVLAATLSLETRLPRRPAAVGPLLAAALVALGFGERVRADTRGIHVPPLPEFYALLQHSQAKGGLLELPFDPWGRISSVKRMLWQPLHGRPIVAGKVSLDPAWYTPAGEVFELFPSEESVLLLRAWGVGSVLDARPDAWRQLLPDSLPEGLVLRAELGRPEGPVRLFDVLRLETPDRLAEPVPGTGRWLRSDAAATAPAHRPAVDGSLETAASFEAADGPLFVVPEQATASAVELDYGAGRFSRVPTQLQVQTLVEGVWRDVTQEPTGSLLRARAADQLMKKRRARLVIVLRENARGPLRLVTSAGPWDLPEIRLLTTEGSGLELAH